MREKLRALTPNLAPPSVSLADWNKGAGSPVSKLFGKGAPVQDSEELQRILALPRRAVIDLDGGKNPPQPSPRALALVELMTSRLRRKDHGQRQCKCSEIYRRRGVIEAPCITTLMPAQAWALYEAPIAGGLLGIIGVGHGKTGLDILLPMVFPDCKLAVLLVPPGLCQQLADDYELWSEHFDVPSLIIEGKGSIKPGRPVIHVVKYSKFCRQENTDLLERLAPDLIISDEGHRLRHPDTATTARVLRYCYQHGAKFCIYSGTMTDKSIKDYAHLAAMALGAGSPLPIDPAVVEEWSCAVDPDAQGDAGELRQLCKPSENFYQGFGRRLNETRGVTVTKNSSINATLNIFERRPPPMPPQLASMLRELRRTGTRPDGEELVDQLEVDGCARQIGCGFFYRWKFPKGEPESLIEEWFACRKAYFKELRNFLKPRREHLDSPLLCWNAAERFHTGYVGPLPTWESETWQAWNDIKDQVYHEQDIVWVDDYLAKDCAAWALKHRGIVWYEHKAFGRKVAELTSLPMYGGGEEAAQAMKREKGKRSVIASIKSHGTGKDGYQRIWREQLVPNPPASATLWEQLLGRLHRPGQLADEVNTYVYRHTEEMAASIDRAVRRAKYIEGSLTQLQKLLIATCDFSLDVD